MYKCSGCDFLSDYRSTIVNHINKAKKCSTDLLEVIKLDIKIKCDYCEKELYDKNTKKRHLKTCKKKISQEYEENEKKIKDLENKVEELCKSETATLDQIKELVINGENINKTRCKNTPLTLLLSWNKPITLDMIKYMVEAGADINHEDLFGATPLMYLCDSQTVTLDMIKYMVENGANINHENKDKETSLMWLCNNETVTLDMVKYMIDHGARINDQDKDKSTPLIWLCHNNTAEKKIEIIKYMIEKGANVNITDVWNSTALTHICINSSLTIEEKLEITRYIKKYITNIDEEVKRIEHKVDRMDKSDKLELIIELYNNVLTN